MVFESKIRQVGTSFGILIPKEVVTSDGLKKNQLVKVAILKEDSLLLKKAFGSIKAHPFVREHNDRVM